MRENILLIAIFIFICVCGGLSGFCFYKMAEGYQRECGARFSEVSK